MQLSSWGSAIFVTVGSCPSSCMNFAYLSLMFQVLCHVNYVKMQQGPPSQLLIHVFASIVNVIQPRSLGVSVPSSGTVQALYHLPQYDQSIWFYILGLSRLDSPESPSWVLTVCRTARLCSCAVLCCRLPRMMGHTPHIVMSHLRRL